MSECENKSVQAEDQKKVSLTPDSALTTLCVWCVTYQLSAHFPPNVK